MSALSIVAIFLVLSLPAGYLTFRYWKGRKQASDAPDDGWDKARALRELIGSAGDVRALYAELGHFPRLEWRLERLVGDLEGLIRAEIPDFSAFLTALKGILEQVEKEGGEPSGPMAQAWFQKGDDDLLKAVLTAGDDRDRTLELLNRDPVREPLPFIEQLPFYRDGKLIWRTPVGLSVIRKRPANSAHFAHILNEIESLVRTARLQRSRQARSEVVEDIARLRRGLQREDAYFPTLLKSLEKKVSEWLHGSQTGNAKERKAQLEGLLVEMLSLRHTCGLDDNPEKIMQKAEADAFKKAARRQARAYLDSPWMHVPRLRTYLLTNLIDSELASLNRWTQRRPFFPAGVLRLVRGEIASGQYDAEENIRRLQKQEEKGFYVHSLIYALLRL